MECLKNIVGISKMDCICLTDGLTTEQIEEAQKSTSGLYLDSDLSGGIKLQDVKYLDACGELFKIAKQSIESAEREFYDDVRVEILNKYKSSKPTFIGDLGRLQYSGFMGSNKPLQFLQIRPVSLSGATMKIDTVRINISASKSVNVKLISVIEGLTYGDVVFETTVNTQANKWTSVNIPPDLKLPLSVSGRKMFYFFVWEKTGTEQAVDNATSCGCSGGDAYQNYIQLTGGQAEDYDNLNNGSEKFARGFSIGAQIYCETSGLVCDLLTTSEIFKLVTPWAILFKAGVNLINNVLKSSEINRITMMNREVLWGTRNNFLKEYQNRVAYLGSEVDLSQNECFSCSNKTMYVGNIYGQKH